MLRYEIKREISLPLMADPKKADLNLGEVRGKGCRVIGGDKGDLEHKGYTLDEENKLTILYQPVLLTTTEGLSEDEAFDTAVEILMNSFESIGVECVEHN